MAMEKTLFEDVFPVENGVFFYCYVSLPEGTCRIFLVDMVVELVIGYPV